MVIIAGRFPLEGYETGDHIKGLFFMAHTFPGILNFDIIMATTYF